MPVVHHYEVAFGTTVVRVSCSRICSNSPLLTACRSWQPARLLFDRSGLGQAAIEAPAEWKPTPPDYEGQTGYTWHDVLHACAAVRRQRPWQAVFYLQRITSAGIVRVAQPAAVELVEPHLCHQVPGGA